MRTTHGTPSSRLTRSWGRLGLASLLFVGFAGTASVAGASGPELPRKRTKFSQIEPAGVDHHEVLRIKANGLGPADSYDIVIDAWTLEADGSIAGVKMWWLDRAKANERSPFGKTVKSRIDVQYRRRSATVWDVKITAGGESFTIEVRAEDGDVSAYGTVVSGGAAVPHCRATSSKVIPTTMLGIPTGFDKLHVNCLDENGIQQRGRLK